MNENTKETYAAETQRASFVGSLDVGIRSVVDKPRLMPDLRDQESPCTERAGIRTESPGTAKTDDWTGTAAARRQPSSSLFH